MGSPNVWAVYTKKGRALTPLPKMIKWKRKKKGQEKTYKHHLWEDREEKVMVLGAIKGIKRLNKNKTLEQERQQGVRERIQKKSGAGKKKTTRP